MRPQQTAPGKLPLDKENFWFWIFSFRHSIKKTIATIITFLSLFITLLTLIYKIFNISDSDIIQSIDSEYLILANTLIIVLLLILATFPGLDKYTRPPKKDADNRYQKIFDKFLLKESSDLKYSKQNCVILVKLAYIRANVAIKEFLANIRNLLYAWIALYCIILFKNLLIR